MRRLLTLLACLLVTSLAMADKVSEMEALKKAKAFMPGKRFELQKYASSLSEEGMAAEEPFYIFNVENGGGYVLVSANDQTTAILGYSTNGNIDLANIPDNLRYWLESYAAQLKAIDEGTPIAARAVAGDKAMTRGTRSNIDPMITAKWNQDEPYNLMCPDGSFVDYNAEGYNANNRCVTGCVATAVAQVMYYHKRPVQTTAIPAYTMKYISNNIVYEGSFNALPATELEWTKMKDDYDKTETGDAADAVAKLMRYVGQGFHMGYGVVATGGSGTNIYNDAMVNYFNYSKKIHTRERDYYTTKQWEDMVYDELAHGRPVPYGGFTSGGGGHQFVCDGYKDGLFSLNWGWGGKLNGYFVLSIADPNGQQGIGGSTGAYKIGQDAVFYFMPAAENEEEVPILKSADGINNTPTSYYNRHNASENFSNVSVPISFKSWYCYIPTTTYDAEVGWGLYQDENLIQCLGFTSYSIDMRKILYPNNQYLSADIENFAVSFGAGLSDGQYQLRQIWRKANSSEGWTLMDNYGANYLLAEINGTSLRIRSKDVNSSVFSVNSITVPDVILAGEQMSATVNVTNVGESNQIQILLWAQKDGTEEWTNVASMTSDLDPNESGDIVLKFTPQTVGTYHLKVTNNSSDNALKEIDITVTQLLTEKVGDLNYSYIPGSGKATVVASETGEYASLTTIEIPASVTIGGKEYIVKAIGENAFLNCQQLKNLTLNEGIETIEKKAFRYCNLLSDFTMPTSLRRIGSEAFYNCIGLRNVILPEGFETLEASAFAACNGMLKLVLPSTLSSIGQYVINGCSALTTVVSHIQEPFLINNNTFTSPSYNSDTQQIIYNPSSAKLYIPLNSMSKYMAIPGWTKFKGIEEGEILETTVNGLSYSYSTGSKEATVISGDNYSAINNLVIPATVMIENVQYTVKAIGAEAFQNCSNLETITLPDGLEAIGNSAFKYCYYISDFAMPKSLKSIGSQAFVNCIYLTEVVLPEGFESLGTYAFAYCTNLKKIELPSSMSSIGDRVILGCSNLKDVVSHVLDPIQVSIFAFAKAISYDQTTQQYVITLSPATLYVPKGSKPKYEAVAGWTMFQGGIKEMGDADGDGEVTMSDAVGAIDYILGGNPEGFNAAAVDMNGDGVVTVTDIILLIITYSLLP